MRCHVQQRIKEPIDITYYARIIHDGAVAARSTISSETTRNYFFCMGFWGGRDLGAVLLHSLLRTWILCLFHKEVPFLQYSSSITNSLTVVPAVRGQCMHHAVLQLHSTIKSLDLVSKSWREKSDCCMSDSSITCFQGAVCLDGSAAGYYIRKGSGSGADKWILHLEGGGWCVNETNCYDRSMTMLGSSKMWPASVSIGGFLSDNSTVNPDFYNWNIVYLMYCDGGSFAGSV